MSNIHFLYPLYFLLLPLIFICFRYCPKKEDSLLFSTLKFFPSSKNNFNILEVLKYLTFFFLIISLASPYTTKTFQKINLKTNAIVLDIDISGSLEDDFKDIKKIVKDFIKNQKNSLFGVVFFADSASVFSPLTLDREFLLKIVDSVNIGDLGDNKTTINDSLILSTNLLKNKKIKDKIIILLTDGIERGSKNSFFKTKRYLDEQNITTIAIGFGEDFDKRYLNSISNNFLNAKDKKALNEIFKRLSKKYSSKQTLKQKQIQLPLYQFPLFFAFLSLLLYLYFLNKRVIL